MRKIVHVEYARLLYVPNNSTVLTNILTSYKPLATKTIYSICQHGVNGMAYGVLSIYTGGSISIASIEYDDTLRGSFIGEYKYA